MSTESLPTTVSVADLRRVEDLGMYLMPKIKDMFRGYTRQSAFVQSIDALCSLFLPAPEIIASWSKTRSYSSEMVSGMIDLRERLLTLRDQVGDIRSGVTDEVTLAGLEVTLAELRSDCAALAQEQVDRLTSYTPESEQLLVGAGKPLSYPFDPKKVLRMSGLHTFFLVLQITSSLLTAVSAQGQPTVTRGALQIEELRFPSAISYRPTSDVIRATVSNPVMVIDVGTHNYTNGGEFTLYRVMGSDIMVNRTGYLTPKLVGHFEANVYPEPIAHEIKIEDTTLACVGVNAEDGIRWKCTSTLTDGGTIDYKVVVRRDGMVLGGKPIINDPHWNTKLFKSGWRVFNFLRDQLGYYNDPTVYYIRSGKSIIRIVDQTASGLNFAEDLQNHYTRMLAGAGEESTKAGEELIEMIDQELWRTAIEHSGMNDRKTYLLREWAGKINDARQNLADCGFLTPDLSVVKHDFVLTDVHKEAFVKFATTAGSLCSEIITEMTHKEQPEFNISIGTCLMTLSGFLQASHPISSVGVAEWLVRINAATANSVLMVREFKEQVMNIPDTWTTYYNTFLKEKDSNPNDWAVGLEKLSSEPILLSRSIPNMKTNTRIYPLDDMGFREFYQRLTGELPKVEVTGVGFEAFFDAFEKASEGSYASAIERGRVGITRPVAIGVTQRDLVDYYYVIGLDIGKNKNHRPYVTLFGASPNNVVATLVPVIAPSPPPLKPVLFASLATQTEQLIQLTDAVKANFDQTDVFIDDVTALHTNVTDVIGQLKTNMSVFCEVGANWDGDNWAQNAAIQLNNAFKIFLNTPMNSTIALTTAAEAVVTRVNEMNSAVAEETKTRVTHARDKIIKGLETFRLVVQETTVTSNFTLASIENKLTNARKVISAGVVEFNEPLAEAVRLPQGEWINTLFNNVMEYVNQTYHASLVIKSENINIAKLIKDVTDELATVRLPVDIRTGDAHNLISDTRAALGANYTLGAMGPAPESTFWADITKSISDILRLKGKVSHLNNVLSQRPESDQAAFGFQSLTINSTIGQFVNITNEVRDALQQLGPVAQFIARFDENPSDIMTSLLTANANMTIQDMYRNLVQLEGECKTLINNFNPTAIFPETNTNAAKTYGVALAYICFSVHATICLVADSSRYLVKSRAFLFDSDYQQLTDPYVSTAASFEQGSYVPLPEMDGFNASQPFPMKVLEHLIRQIGLWHIDASDAAAFRTSVDYMLGISDQDAHSNEKIIALPREYARWHTSLRTVREDVQGLKGDLYLSSTGIMNREVLRHNLAQANGDLNLVSALFSAVPAIHLVGKFLRHLSGGKLLERLAATTVTSSDYMLLWGALLQVTQILPINSSFVAQVNSVLGGGGGAGWDAPVTSVVVGVVLAFCTHTFNRNNLHYPHYSDLWDSSLGGLTGRTSSGDSYRIWGLITTLGLPILAKEILVAVDSLGVIPRISEIVQAPALFYMAMGGYKLYNTVLGGTGDEDRFGVAWGSFGKYLNSTFTTRLGKGAFLVMVSKPCRRALSHQPLEYIKESAKAYADITDADFVPDPVTAVDDSPNTAEPKVTITWPALTAAAAVPVVDAAVLAVTPTSFLWKEDLINQTLMRCFPPVPTKQGTWHQGLTPLLNSTGLQFIQIVNDNSLEFISARALIGHISLLADRDEFRRLGVTYTDQQFLALHKALDDAYTTLNPGAPLTVRSKVEDFTDPSGEKLNKPLITYLTQDVRTLKTLVYCLPSVYHPDTNPQLRGGKWLKLADEVGRTMDPYVELGPLASTLPYFVPLGSGHIRGRRAWSALFPPGAFDDAQFNFHTPSQSPLGVWVADIEAKLRTCLQPRANTVNWTEPTNANAWLRNPEVSFIVHMANTISDAHNILPFKTFLVAGVNVPSHQFFRLRHAMPAAVINGAPRATYGETLNREWTDAGCVLRHLKALPRDDSTPPVTIHHMLTTLVGGRPGLDFWRKLETIQGLLSQKLARYYELLRHLPADPMFMTNFISDTRIFDYTMEILRCATLQSDLEYCRGVTSLMIECHLVLENLKLIYKPLRGVTRVTDGVSSSNRLSLGKLRTQTNKALFKTPLTTYEQPQQEVLAAAAGKTDDYWQFIHNQNKAVAVEGVQQQIQNWKLISAHQKVFAEGVKTPAVPLALVHYMKIILRKVLILDTVVNTCNSYNNKNSRRIHWNIGSRAGPFNVDDDAASANPDSALLSPADDQMVGFSDANNTAHTSLFSALFGSVDRLIVESE